MKNYLISLTIFFVTLFSFGQNYYAKILPTYNDSSRTVQIKIKGNPSFLNNKIISFQEKLTVIENGTEKDYYPKDLKSFQVKIDKDVFTFVNVDDLAFAEQLYSNKLKLFKYLKKTNSYPSPSIIRVYMIKKPNEAKMDELIAAGFSRLITKNEMLNSFKECKSIYQKIENDDIKIKNEDNLIDFVKELETSCYN